MRLFLQQNGSLPKQSHTCLENCLHQLLLNCIQNYSNTIPTDFIHFKIQTPNCFHNVFFVNNATLLELNIMDIKYPGSGKWLFLCRHECTHADKLYATPVYFLLFLVHQVERMKKNGVQHVRVVSCLSDQSI